MEADVTPPWSPVPGLIQSTLSEVFFSTMPRGRGSDFWVAAL